MAGATSARGGAFKALLTASGAAAVGVVVFVLGGQSQPSSQRVSLESLSATDRARLVEEAVAQSPGVFQQAWYDAQIGYTLRPNATVSAWGDTFRTNEIGYRTGPVRKTPGTFRIVVVGDSWAFGMGVTEEQSFPKVLERLANEHAGVARPVETWTLALPGYNTLNQVAAFTYFADQLEPDAVVFVPSSNDNHSLPEVLPNGSLHAGAAGTPDRFGDPHLVGYRVEGPLDAYRWNERWTIAMQAMADALGRLESRGVPAALLFVARWSEPYAHHLMAAGEIDEVPYAVAPRDLTLDPWLTDLPNPHGNPAAQERYAALLYRVLEGPLGWRPLPDGIVASEIADVHVHATVPPASEWSAAYRSEAVAMGERAIPAQFRMGPGDHLGWAGPGDPETGAVGRATTVLIRPPPGTSALKVGLAPVSHGLHLHPVTVRARVLGESPMSVAGVVLDVRNRNVTLDVLPTEDREALPVLEVQIKVDRAATSPDSLLPRSVILESIVPVVPDGE